MIPPRGRRAGGRRAVTLIEVLVVLGLLGAMLALALPITLRSMERNSFRAAVDAVVASLDESRSHAQREGVMVEVVVDREGHRLRALAREPDGGEANAIPSLEVGFETPLELLGDRGDGLLVLFLPDGSAPMARRVTVRGTDGALATVSIGPMLGRATVVERRSDPDAEPAEDAALDDAADAGIDEAAP